ncbi:hypothetical protein ACLOJK_028549 [Asimina triloba]
MWVSLVDGRKLSSDMVGYMATNIIVMFPMPDVQAGRPAGSGGGEEWVVDKTLVLSGTEKGFNQDVVVDDPFRWYGSPAGVVNVKLRLLNAENDTYWGSLVVGTVI